MGTKSILVLGTWVHPKQFVTFRCLRFLGQFLVPILRTCNAQAGGPRCQSHGRKKVITGGAAYAHVCSGTRAECFCKRRNANLILRALRALLPEASRRFPERPRASRRPPEGFPRASQSVLEAPKSSQNVPARLGSSQNATRTSQNVPEVSKRPPSKHPMFMKTLL